MLTILLILTSLIGYLEWGKDNHILLIEAEIEIITKFFNDPMSVMHPFVVLPFMGQLMLLFTVFQKKPNKILGFIGMGCIGLLLFFMFAIGIMNLNFKILLSTLPFLVTSILIIRQHRIKK